MKFNSTEQVISWFRDQYAAGRLRLKPPFQRQPVWSDRQKHHLIESVLLELPIPEIYVQVSVEDGDGDTGGTALYWIVDGQQRIRSILQFIGVDQDESELDYNKFALTRLDPQSPFAGVRFADLSPEAKRAFIGYKLSVRQLDTNDDEAVRGLFKRLNKYSTKLNDQELRNATFTGPFMRLSLELADSSYWVEQKLVSPAQIRRMKDIEFVSELLIGLMHGPQAGSGKSVDEFYRMYEDYDDEFPEQRITKRRFDQTLEAIKSILGSGNLERFKSNRTDFYSLFVAVGSLLSERRVLPQSFAAVAETLLDFERQVDVRLSDESRNVPNNVVDYVRAVEKGANDKARRADRHRALLEVLSPHFGDG